AACVVVAAAIMPGGGVASAPQARLSPALGCGLQVSPPPAASSETLQTVARHAETMPSRRGADARLGDEALDMLEVGTGERAAAEPAAVAAYCSAAGESMRLARSGSQLQAQSYLVAAIRAAERAQDARLAAIASYRLALAT